MSRDGIDLDDLLLEWEERRERGDPVTPERVCAAVPHLIHELVRRIRLLEGCDRLLAVEIPASGEADGGPDVPVPELVAGYEVLGVLGRGGTGIVYKTRDPVLCRVIAVKALRPASPTADEDDRRRLADRFRREGQVLARLRHEAIVPVFEARVHNGIPCLVMEYEPGGSLADRRAELTAGGPAVVVPLVERVARAIAYVHRQGVLHRDLKPANLLFDADGRVRVSDFGLAKLINTGDSLPSSAPSPDAAQDTVEDTALATQLTAPGLQPGTWAYMAPEQYDPAGFGSIGPATDVWALGVILYELLADRHPFPGRTWGELRERVCERPVPPVTGVGRRLRRVIERCLAKNPARRFRTAEELADALRAAAPRRRRWPAAALGAALALAVGSPFLPSAERIVPTWPDLPAVREAQDRLARGEEVTLIGPGRTPAAFDLATGPGSGRVFSPTGEPFHVVSASPVGCLVEFVPALPVGRYRIDAELLHETGNGMSWVGLYAGASHCEIPRGRQHFLVLARYSDRGWTAEEKSENRSVTSNRRTHLLAQYLGEPTNALTAGHARSAAHPGGHLIPAPPVDWRHVSLTVDELGAEAAQAGTAVGSLDLETLEKTLAEARQRYPDLPGLEWPARPHGGVGLYVYNGSLRVRLFRITPLNAGQ